ncbi:hypothetical protein H4R34_005011 [Dimargaris verticillata]|uniref:Mediator of RNA polymerase II transcription subunit 1 n=1 Tax=Dimargaris verticillata TaxID=2761393 RepID=A0A9W8B1F4_9FUNG|nr:hypothetical protein H4R34_005011 [Dimargaris verticillata]
MSASETAKVHDLLTQLRQGLGNLIPRASSGLCADGVAPKPLSSSLPWHQAELHPLGPINYDAAHGEFTRIVNQIRRIFQDYRDQTLASEAFNLVTAATLLRKAHTSMREESRLLSLQQQYQETMAICLQQLKTHSDDARLVAEQLVQQLKDIAERQRMTYYVDTSNSTSDQQVTTVTLCGSIVVIDVDVTGDNGQVLQVKVTYATGSKPDAKVDHILSQQLKQGDLAAFTKSVATLALLDRLTKQHEPIDFFRIMLVVGQDLQAIFDRERVAAHQDLNQVLKFGHGIPCHDCFHPGPTLLYWMPSLDRHQCENQLMADPASCSDRFHALWISVEESTVPMCFLPPDRDSFIVRAKPVPNSENNGRSAAASTAMEVDAPAGIFEASSTAPSLAPNPHLQFFHPNPETSPAAQARFVAYLRPPVAIAETYARSLAILCGVNVTDLGIHNVSSPLVPHADLLLNLSVTDQLARNKTAFSFATTPASVLTSNPASTSSSSFAWTLPAEVAHGQHGKYNGTSTKPPSFRFLNTGEPVGAVLVHRIPFTHLSQLLTIIQLLRQHNTFNALLQSCFNVTTWQAGGSHNASSGSTGDGGDDLTLHTLLQATQAAIPIEIMAEPPLKLLVSFSIPIHCQDEHGAVFSGSTAMRHYSVALEIILDMDPTNDIRVNVISSSHNSSSTPGADSRADHITPLFNRVCRAERLSKVLQRVQSIPLMVYWIWQQTQAALRH